MNIPIVDENDNIIGYKERDNLDPNDIIRISVIWITDEKGNILLQQRSLNVKINPGKWGPAVSGTVEEGETYESNAYKELDEEIGVRDIKLVESEKFFGMSNTRKRFAQLYLAQINSNSLLVPQESEVEQIKWFSKEEVIDFYTNEPDKFPPLMGELIKLLIK